jgi:hypothetical protein
MLRFAWFEVNETNSVPQGPKALLCWVVVNVRAEARTYQPVPTGRT